jgi:hypothetical protein
MKPQAILMGPFVGEMFWEAFRFASMLPYYKFKEYKDKQITYIILTREERFDLYGRNADIFVPLRIDGDYINKSPECFRLMNQPEDQYNSLVKKFREKYENYYTVVQHIYPNISRKNYLDKYQYSRDKMIFVYNPRFENYKFVEQYLPHESKKPLVVLASRFRKGFRRNWKYWPDFYDLISNDSELTNDFNFILCGKPGEYIPDEKNRFLDMNKIILTKNSSLIGILLVILENAFFTFGSQSAIPNLSLLYKVDVLTFGNEKNMHSKVYNVFDSPITFIENQNFDITPDVIFKVFKNLLKSKKEKLQNESTESMD